MHKARVVNIEWTPDNNRWNLDKQVFSELKLKWIFKELKQAAKDGCDTVIAVMMIDGVLNPEPNIWPGEVAKMKERCTKLGIEKLVFVSGHGGHEYMVPVAFDKMYAIDYTLQFTYKSYEDRIKKNKLTQYNPHADKFLFLGGVPSRMNRIGLLYKYYKLGMLDYNAIWTFFVPWTEEERRVCKDIMHILTEEELTEFCNFAERRIGDEYEHAKKFFAQEYYKTGDFHDVGETDWARAPALIDSSIFPETCLSIISEGPNYWDHNANNSFVTEKFWRAAFHKHPFLFAGDLDQFKYMETLGFRTFTEYMTIPEYAHLETEEQRLDAIVNNTADFLKLKKPQKLIDDIEHNYELAKRYVDKQHLLFDYLVEHYGASRDEVNYYLNQTGYSNLIQRPPSYE
jgi:hypothetical protein